MHQYLSEGILFRFREFHKYGKKFFWRVAAYSIFSLLVLSIFVLIIGIIGDLSGYIINTLKKYSHTISVFFNVFFYLSIMLLVVSAFILWISFTLFGYYGIVHKNLSFWETIKDSKRLIIKYPQCLSRALILFVIYILTGGFILSLGSLFAILPDIGTILAAVYQFLNQFAQIYITMVIFATFFAYYLGLQRTYQEAMQEMNTFSQEAPQPVESPPLEDNSQKPENHNP